MENAMENAIENARDKNAKTNAMENAIGNGMDNNAKKMRWKMRWTKEAKTMQWEMQRNNKMHRGSKIKTHEIKRGNQALTIFRLVLNPMISNCKTFQKSRH